MSKKAHFIKIYIKAEDTKLNFIPIPFFLSNTIITTIRYVYSISHKNKKDNDLDINELLKDATKIIKELKNYPPFEIVNIESDETTVIIKTI